jgi:RES domain-containing protein
MTGAGAAYSPGRWNKPGETVIYAAPSLAMAVLETAAHIDDSGLPLNKYVVEIDVPDDVWEARLVVDVASLPVGWDAIPHGMISVDAGSAWYAGGSQVLIQLPSAIVPEESIVLVNAQHHEARRLFARTTRRFQYNLLFRNSR